MVVCIICWKCLHVCGCEWRLHGRFVVCCVWVVWVLCCVIGYIYVGLHVISAYKCSCSLVYESLCVWQLCVCVCSVCAWDVSALVFVMCGMCLRVCAYVYAFVRGLSGLSGPCVVLSVIHMWDCISSLLIIVRARSCMSYCGLSGPCFVLLGIYTWGCMSSFL